MMVNETNNKVGDVKTVKMKAVGGYVGEYCDRTGIHGVQYLNEKRSLFERYVIDSNADFLGIKPTFKHRKLYVCGRFVVNVIETFFNFLIFQFFNFSVFQFFNFLIFKYFNYLIFLILRFVNFYFFSFLTL